MTDNRVERANAYRGIDLGGIQYTLDGYTVSVRSGPVVDGPCVRFELSSVTAPDGRSLPVDGAYIFVNPPTKGGNLYAVARQIILDAALSYANSRGGA